LLPTLSHAPFGSFINENLKTRTHHQVSEVFKADGPQCIVFSLLKDRESGSDNVFKLSLISPVDPQPSTRNPQP
jgi:hypothetical protein